VIEGQTDSPATIDPPPELDAALEDERMTELDLAAVMEVSRAETDRRSPGPP
jgi:hypothetical protein